MNARRVLIVFSFLVLALAAATAQGQSCQQGGGYLCGPCQGYNLIWDPDFSQTSCGSWQFDSYTERASNGTCVGTEDVGRFYGPSSDWRGIYQTTIADRPGDHFPFAYDVEIINPNNNPNVELQVWIFQPNATWFYVDTVSGATSCDYRIISLGQQSTWDGNAVHIYFWGKVPDSSASIKIDRVGLDQY